MSLIVLGFWSGYSEVLVRSAAESSERRDSNGLDCWIELAMDANGLKGREVGNETVLFGVGRDTKLADKPEDEANGDDR